MKTIADVLRWLFALGIACLFASRFALADDHVLRVGVYQNPPQVFIDDQGNPGGIYVDILNEVARLEGWTIEYVPGSFAEGLEAVRLGKIDAMTSIAATPERDRFVDFSKETVISVWGQLYVSPGFSPNNILDMDGKSIAVMESGVLGNNFAKLCNNFEVECNIVPLTSYQAALQAVDDGKADAAVVNSILGFALELQYKARRSHIVFSPFRLQVAFPEGRGRTVIEALDRHLAKWRDDKASFYYETLDYWLGVKPEATKEVPAWAWTVIALGLLAIVLIFAWNATLRHQISQRRKAEEALKKSEARFRELVENTSVIAWELDLEKFVFTYVSPHAEAMLGYPIDEWKKDGFWAEHIALEDRDEAVNYCLEETQAGHDHAFEYRMIKADGSLIWLRDIVTVHKDDTGKPSYLSGFLVNIDEQKATETALQEAKSLAEKANRAKSEFLASMSHDLRTPLNAIMGFSDMMRQKAFGPIGDPHYEEYAKDIHDSGTMLLSLIDDVLDLSKVEAGKYELVETPINLSSLIGSAINMVSTFAGLKNIAVVSEIEIGLPPLKADQRAMTQILNNLLSNAVKFTPHQGSISIHAGLGAGRQMAIRVRDNGIGMSEKDIEKVLNPFEQADSQHSRHHEGTGLGLHICKRFLELHGGGIEIESQPEKGTTITVFFPPERTL